MKIKTIFSIYFLLFFLCINTAIAKTSKDKSVDQTLKLIEGVRGEALSTLLKLEKKYKKGSQHAEIVIRIAELYYEKAKETEEKEIRKFNIDVANYHKKRVGNEPKLNTSGSRNYLNRSIQTNQNIIKSYPKHPMIDKVYFNQAFNYKDLGQNKTAISFFHQLLKTSPNSSLAPDALLNIAEYHFDNNNWEDAKNYYTQAAQYKNTSIYGYSLYKLGWTYYNLKEYPLAISQLEKVAEYSRSPVSNIEGSKINLLQESLKDVVLFFSESGDRLLAKDYFFRLGGKDNYVWMLERLAKIYVDNGNHQNAIAVYNDLIKIDKYYHKNPSWTIAIIDSYETINNMKMMMERINDLIITYQESSSWGKFHRSKKDEKVLKEVYDLRENTLRTFAKKYHNFAREKRRANHYDIAAELYEKYLSFFSKDTNSYELRFFYGELLFERQKFMEAAHQYSIVRDDIRSKDHLEKAAFNVIYSYDKKINEYEYAISSNLQNKRKLLHEILKIEKRQIFACDKYIEMVPKGKEIINIKFKAARLLYKHKDYENARPRFAHIAEAYPKNENAVFSVHLMLDSFNVEKDWENLNKWARHFYANETLVKQKSLATELYALIVDSAFKICLKIEAEKKYEQAADKFNEFAQEFPGHKLAKDAIFNSARNYENADKLISAIEMHKKFIQTYPTDIDVKYALKSLAVNHEKIGYIQISASYYDAFVKRYPKDEDAEKASYNIALFYEMSGNFAEGEARYRAFLVSYPRSKLCTEAILALVEINSKNQNLKEEEKYLKMYIGASNTNPDEVIKAIVRLGKIALLNANTRGGHNYFRDTVKYYNSRKKKDFIIGQRYAAEAQFLLADSHYEKFTSIRLTLPKDKMIKQISDKIKIMETMNKEYSKVFDFGATEFAIASLYKIGLSYEDFSKMLFNAPMPKNLTTEEIQAFKMELEEVAFPIEEKAITSFEANVKKAYESKIGTKWADLSYRKMFTYKPKLYPLEIMEIGPSFIESGRIYKVD